MGRELPSTCKKAVPAASPPLTGVSYAYHVAARGSVMVHRYPMFRPVTLLTAALLATTMAGFSAAAQEKPAPLPPHDMEHMQHSHDGGFMQGGMHHAVAKGVSLDARLDVASHTLILREGPITLPANTSYMKMPQPPDVYWTIDFDGWLLSYSPKLVDASGQSVPGTVLHHTAFW